LTPVTQMTKTKAAYPVLPRKLTQAEGGGYLA